MSEPTERMVLELRDRPSGSAGKKPITDAMSAAMAERGASSGVYLGSSAEGFAREIGDWCEGSATGPWIATTTEHLHTAIRFLAVKVLLGRSRGRGDAIDVQEIAAKVAAKVAAIDSYAAAQKLGEANSDPIGVTPRTLGRRLKEQGRLLETDEDRGRVAVRKMIGSRRLPVWVLRQDTLSQPSQPSLAPASDPHQDASLGDWVEV